MVDAVTSDIIFDGPKHTIMKFTNLSDGSGESAVIKVNASDLLAMVDGTASIHLKITRIEYATSGMAVDLLFDATANVLAWSCPADESNVVDFEEHGILNNAGTGVTGDILFTTRGHTSGDTYVIILHMIKKG